MNKFLYFIMAGILSASFVNAQQENPAIIMSIDNDSITKTEFEKVYRKNNVNDGPYDMED